MACGGQSAGRSRMLESLWQVLGSGDLIYATLRLTTPLLFAALGGLLCERAGVLNIGLEGMMLGGGLTAYVVALRTGNPWLGILAALVVGAATGLLFAVVVVAFRASQVVSAGGVGVLLRGLACRAAAA